jgi:hypothetical protein
MISLTQSEFARLARGDVITPGLGPNVDYFVLGIGSSARASVRRVHTESVDAARSHFAGATARYLYGAGTAAATVRMYRACIERYISLDGWAASAVDLPTKGLSVSFPPGNVVRARPDVVFGPNADDLCEARVLLWDELPLNRSAAEMIALPVLRYVRNTQDADARVAVWQLSRQEEEIVSPDEADARQADVENLLVAADTGN